MQFTSQIWLKFLLESVVPLVNWCSMREDSAGLRGHTVDLRVCDPEAVELLCSGSESNARCKYGQCTPKLITARLGLILPCRRAGSSPTSFSRRRNFACCHHPCTSKVAAAAVSLRESPRHASRRRSPGRIPCLPVDVVSHVAHSFHTGYCTGHRTLRHQRPETAARISSPRRRTTARSDSALGR